MVQQEVRKGPWTEQEDFKLVSFVGLFGDRRWDFIAKVSGLKVAGDSKIGIRHALWKNHPSFNHLTLL